MNCKRRRYSFILCLFSAVLFSLCVSGCQVIELFQITPGPLETPTPKLSLNQITDIPTLPAVTSTPTPPIGSSTRYIEPNDIFNQVTEEKLPQKAHEQVVIFGTVSDFVTQSDYWGNISSTGAFTIRHHSGTEFHVNCDDYCFYVDARKNLTTSNSLAKGSEIIIFGASGDEVTDINADLIAVHTIITQPETFIPDMSSFASGLTYTEYELESFPKLNPISIQAARVTSTPAAQTDAAEQDTSGYSYGYGQDSYNYNNYYGYGYYGQPTSTPNRPQWTPTPNQTATPEPTPTKSLDDLLTERLNHSLESRSSYSFGAYGEIYSVYLEYEQDLNRDPEYPTRADMNIDSNGYTFTDFWFPYVENPMFVNWGIINYGGDWYLPFRMTVDIDPDPSVTDLVYTDRTLRSLQNFDKQKGYIRSFGFSIINRNFFYFYQTEKGYGISINLQDYDLGFDEIPFGLLTDYTELDPFYSDDLITFFGHRGGKWYYVEIAAVKTNYWY